MTGQQAIVNEILCYAEAHSWDMALDAFRNALDDGIAHCHEMIRDGDASYESKLEKLERNWRKLRGITFE